MQNLQLDRSLVCFDLETTGTDVLNDRIVQVALIRLEPGGERRTFSTLVNPGRPIPASATAVHGIDDAMVMTAPHFGSIMDDLMCLLEGADLTGFNFIRFDLPLLEAEVARHGRTLEITGRRLIDAMTIFHRREPRHLEAAVRFYCGHELIGAHSAQADAEATLAVLDAQLARYPDLPRNPGDLHEYCNPEFDRYVDRARKFRWNDQGEAELSFGKHAGKSLRSMSADARDRHYLEWMLGSDFAPQTKDIVRRALGGDFPTRR